jgi:hypothetical protein
MVGPLAQSSINPLVIAILFTATSLPIGLLIGYLFGYRYKRHYERVARELANLKGENFRGELSRVGMPQGPAPRPAPLPSGAEKLARAQQLEQELRAALADLTSERDQLAAELEGLRVEAEQWRQAASSSGADGSQAAARPGTNGNAHDADGGNGISRSPTGPPTGTEAWQLAQLHREQIAMQLQLDDSLQQIQQLTAQRDDWQRQASTASTEFQQLRRLLAEQEALIASVERQRDSLATRLSELES